MPLKPRKPRKKQPEIPESQAIVKKTRPKKREELDVVKESFNAGVEFADAIWDLIDFFRK